MPIEDRRERRVASARLVRRLVIAVALPSALGGIAAVGPSILDAIKSPRTEIPSARSARSATPGEFEVTASQRRELSIEAVDRIRFVPMLKAEGKIALKDSTPIFSQYSGARVIEVFANAGDFVARGAPLLRVETVDMIRAGNDLSAAIAALETARSRLRLLTTAEIRMRDLFAAKATALRDWQQAQADLSAAGNEMRIAESALTAARQRLATLGKSPTEISNFESGQVLDPVADIVAPMAAFVMRRKIGPGQYIDAGATDPLYVLGNLSTVWLLASVREADAPHVRIGQAVSARVLAYPDREFSGTIARVGSSIDPVTRRLEVMAEFENSETLLKPEMFAEFSIAIGPPRDSSAIPVQALIRDGDATRVWIQIAQNRFAMRSVQTGLQDHDMVEILSGLPVGDRVVGKGSLFIDRAAQPH